MLCRKPFIVCCCLFIVAWCNAQQADTVLQRIQLQLGIHDSAQYRPDLFLHVDKSLYHVRDDIWFSAYLLNADPAAAHTLHLLLVNDMTLSPVSAQRYVLESGIASGTISIPDSLATGEYSLIAYTNQYLERSGERFFRVPLGILGGTKPVFRVKILNAGGQADSNTNFPVTVQLLSASGATVSKASFHYSVYAGKELVKAGKETSDAFGELRLSIPSRFRYQSLDILGSIDRLKDTMLFKQPVQWPSASARIRFFPEAGVLISGQAALVGLELKGTDGKGISTTCYLVKDADTIASCVTDTYGRGLLRMIPYSGAKYQVLISEPAINTVYQQFPPVQDTSYFLKLADKPITDSMDLAIGVPHAGGACVVVVHNDREMLYGISVALPKTKGVLRIPVSNWPRGMLKVSLYDHTGMLQRQRSIFLPDTMETAVSLTTDLASYSSKLKVKLRVKITDAAGNPVPGIFSFSCALEQVSGNSLVDIKRFQMADRFLAAGVSLPPFHYWKDARNIENVMLDDLSFSYKPRVSEVIGRQYDGKVLMNGKKTRKPITVLVTGASAGAFETEASGDFVIPYELLRGAANSKTMVAVSTKTQGIFSVIADLEATGLNQSLASVYYPLDHYQQETLSSEQKENIRSLKGNMLQEVVVKSKLPDNDDYYGAVGYGGVCDDYVCRNAILNCTVHRRGSEGNSVPVNGQLYYTKIQGMTKLVVYRCAYQNTPPHIRRINATWYPQAYTPLVPGEDNTPEALRQTTLHWQPLVQTDENGEAIIEFYTNELKGKFKAIIQGVSSKGVISGRAEIIVR